MNDITTDFGVGLGDDWVHHVDSYVYIPYETSNGYYSNMGLSAYETVDFQRLSSLVQIQMGTAVTSSMLMAGGSLASLSAGMAMGSSSPSLMSLMTCLGMINIELGVSNPVIQASKINRKNLMTKLSTKDALKRMKGINADEQLDRNEKGVLRSSISFTMLSLYIFKVCYESGIIDSGDISHTDFFKMCFNISHMICYPQLYGGGSHIRSIAQIFCGTIMGQTMCEFRGFRGWGSQLVYYQHYLTVNNPEVHNTFFRNRLPYKSKVGQPSKINSLTTYLCRLVFCSKYSKFDTYLKNAQAQRKYVYSNFNLDKENNQTQFDRFLFYDKNSSSVDYETSVLNEISFDSIQMMINELDKKREDQREHVKSKLNRLLDFVNQYGENYKKIMELYNNKNCTMGESILDRAGINNFQATQKDTYPDEFVINPSLVSDNAYSGKKVLALTEASSISKEQKKMFITTLGNNVTLGFLNVGQYLYNYNATTFDIYVKVRGQEQMIVNAQQIGYIISKYKLSDFENEGIDISILEKVFNNSLSLSAKDRDIANMRLDKYIKLLNEISKYVTALKIRSLQDTNIFNNQLPE